MKVEYEEDIRLLKEKSRHVTLDRTTSPIEKSQNVQVQCSETCCQLQFSFLLLTLSIEDLQLIMPALQNTGFFSAGISGLTHRYQHSLWVSDLVSMCGRPENCTPESVLIVKYNR